MREPWEAHARAAESGAPDTSGSRPGPSIDEYPLSSPYLEGAPWAENGPEKEHESRTGLRPGGFRRRYPPCPRPRGRAPGPVPPSGAPRRARIRFAGCRQRIRARRARVRGRRDPSPDSARTPLMPPGMMREGRFGGNRNRDPGAIILLIKSRLFHKASTCYPHAATTENREVRLGARRSLSRDGGRGCRP